MKLNKEQEIAANHFEGPALVTSCPGSGKTRTLVERTARLIERGVDPKSILCITFTNKAANEMKDRICKRLNVKKTDFFVGTMHSFCTMLLRVFGDRIGYSSAFTILDSDEQVDVTLQIARKLGYEIDKTGAIVIAGAVNDMREKMEGSQFLEDNLYHRFQGNTTHATKVANEYMAAIKRRNMIDFSGILSEILVLFKQNPEVLEIVQKKYKFVQVDECQDTNVAQFEFVNRISAHYNNIMLIGDGSQSVYRFRGARYQNIEDFIKKHDNCRVLFLSKNYRSTPQIVKAADTLIRHNESHLGQGFETDNPDGRDVVCDQSSSPEEEAQTVANSIKGFINNLGYEHSDFAVLYRMNSMAQPLETTFTNYGIKYRTVGGFSFFDRREIKDCIAMLRFLVNPCDGIAFARIAATMTGLGAVTVGKIENYSEDNKKTMLEACKAAPSYIKQTRARQVVEKILTAYENDFSDKHAGECMHELVDKLDYRNYLKKLENGEDRNNNVTELIVSAALFGEKDTEVSKYLQNISLMTTDDDHGDQDKDTVTLMSLHASKGLEFPFVYIVGTEERCLPHYRSLNGDKDDLEEERRLCYVGMTRAQKYLHMSYCGYRRHFKKGSGGKSVIDHKTCFPSRFLYEAKLLEQE